MTVKDGFCLGFPPFLAGFRPWGIGIQVVKTTSALIAMSSSCISTFLVKTPQSWKKMLVCLNSLAQNSSQYDAYHRK